jgi:quercetin dioxygenase-like cupin family protein
VERERYEVLGCADRPEVNDYGAYLAFLADHGHNFIRLWRWEHVRSQAAGGNFHLCMSPQPWRRTGPGTARDGAPRFDLSELDPAYFDRLRDRVVAAGDAGCGVAEVELREQLGRAPAPGAPAQAPQVGHEQQVLGAVEVASPSGAAPPLHVHHREDEAFYILEGEYTVFVGDEMVSGVPGTWVWGPKDVPHGYQVHSPRGRHVSLTMPAGSEASSRRSRTSPHRPPNPGTR